MGYQTQGEKRQAKDTGEATRAGTEVGAGKRESNKTTRNENASRANVYAMCPAVHAYVCTCACAQTSPIRSSLTNQNCVTSPVSDYFSTITSVRLLQYDYFSAITSVRLLQCDYFSAITSVRNRSHTFIIPVRTRRTTGEGEHLNEKKTPSWSFPRVQIGK
ncbi:hypothetical protein POVWA2_007600 [Plasmodium ovale wallikeri]|uniref:Uncharacterized protein n=1 Tax=Plasmodium ovale wallikeri TaxID=864142 RepID=A0A1A8YJ04_PLAOA|nr:hypothetical protein POVWA1_007450 [Plasmodium ovale wallikeri]SBT32072.1 hypothetical protein POVWA2_007600 [Plasmodium ovale wallikeri]